MGRRRTLAAREKDARALLLRQRGLSPEHIAKEMGWDSTGSVTRAIQRSLADSVAESVDEIRMIESARLDDIMRIALKVALEKHYHVAANGRVAENPVTGEPLLDYGPNIQAVNSLRQISESRRKLLGADSAIKHSITIDQIDQEIRALEIELENARNTGVRKAISPSPAPEPPAAG